MTMALRIKPTHRNKLQDAVESAKEAYNTLIDEFNSEIGAKNTELRDLDTWMWFVTHLEENGFDFPTGYEIGMDINVEVGEFMGRPAKVRMVQKGLLINIDNRFAVISNDDLDEIVESEYFNDRDEREYEYLCSRRVA